MGQMTYGIFLGVPDFIENSDSVLDEWEGLNLTKIKESGKSYWEAKAEIVPDFEGDNPTLGAFIGFWVAAGASGKDGADSLEGFPLDDLSRYENAIAQARKRWRTFTDWLSMKWKNEGKKQKEIAPLFEARLYLLETEVA